MAFAWTTTDVLRGDYTVREYSTTTPYMRVVVAQLGAKAFEIRLDALGVTVAMNGVSLDVAQRTALLLLNAILCEIMATYSIKPSEPSIAEDLD